MQRMKEKLSPVMLDIEKRLIALETRPAETSISNVSFTEENPTTMTTLIERVQVLESRVNNLEPSNSTLRSFISSAPLEPPEDHRRRESSVNLQRLLPQRSEEKVRKHSLFSVSKALKKTPDIVFHSLASKMTFGRNFQGQPFKNIAPQKFLCLENQDEKNCFLKWSKAKFLSKSPFFHS